MRRSISSFIISALLEPLLFDTSPRDGLVLALVAGTLFAVGLLASLLPAARATRVDPVVALRSD